LETGAAVIGALLTGIAASPWLRAALRYGAIVLAVLLFLLALRRSGERAGRLAERLETMEKANDVQRQMLEAAARRPRSRNDLADRLRDGRF
jgi:predicted nucleic acid-binding protein